MGMPMPKHFEGNYRHFVEVVALFLQRAGKDFLFQRLYANQYAVDVHQEFSGNSSKAADMDAQEISRLLSGTWVWRMLSWAADCEQREQTGHHNGDKDQTVVKLLQALFSIRPGVPPPSCPY